jgi:hypothetical protein
MMPAIMEDETGKGDRRPGPGSAGGRDAGQNRAGNGTALPYAKAFVVQFAADTDPSLEHASGRIEHLQSGRQARFASMTDLVARIAALLGGDAGKSEPPVR